MREPAEHAGALRPESVCYMLSNVAIGRYCAAHPGADLFAHGTFFRYLLDRSTAPPRGRPPQPVWRNIPFVMQAVEEIAPERVLAVGANAGRWNMLLLEFAGGEFASSPPTIRSISSPRRRMAGTICY